MIKKVRVEQKLVLFYLVNDIVQHSAKKGFTELLDKFKSGIKESMPHLKEEKIAYKVFKPVLFVAMCCEIRIPQQKWLNKTYSFCLITECRLHISNIFQDLDPKAQKVLDPSRS